MRGSKVVTERLLIFNETTEGKIFRPSDWAERLALCCASFSKNKRLAWHTMLRPVYVDNRKCLEVNIVLQHIEPYIWDYVIGFAVANKLKMSDYDTDPSTALDDTDAPIAA